MNAIDALFPPGYEPSDIKHSGKLEFVFGLLKQIRVCGDRVVLVSNYTTTLDLLAQQCKALSYPFVRLDGATEVHFIPTIQAQ
mmetsp:Transcript_57417/g.138703  ORF Transcript_57417/g.138703 Transcript_57417/m.138703 type:complete len:83 (+) Transcript_57417:481-729(+)